MKVAWAWINGLILTDAFIMSGLDYRKVLEITMSGLRTGWEIASHGRHGPSAQKLRHKLAIGTNWHWEAFRDQTYVVVAMEMMKKKQARSTKRWYR